MLLQFMLINKLKWLLLLPWPKCKKDFINLGSIIWVTVEVAMVAQIQQQQYCSTVLTLDTQPARSGQPEHVLWLSFHLIHTGEAIYDDEDDRLTSTIIKACSCSSRYSVTKCPRKINTHNKLSSLCIGEQYAGDLQKDCALGITIFFH